MCVITIIRIARAARIDLTDFTYNLAKLAIITDLEPLLGITIACLPLFPPTFKKAFRARRVGPDMGNVLQSSLARLRIKKSKSKSSTFRRFDYSYPLTDVEGYRTQNHVGTSGSQPRSSFEGRVGEADPEMCIKPSIKVKQGWEVRSDKVT